MRVIGIGAKNINGRTDMDIPTKGDDDKLRVITKTARIIGNSSARAVLLNVYNSDFISSF
ncbi:MAG: hypothetical protein ABIA21_00385 [Candidatus Aenigmatarchaeota archaeon]